MILWNERQWRREMLLCALVFQAIFLIELIGLWGMIVVDPKVHLISYENWGWLCQEWQQPAWQHNYFTQITGTALALNWVAQVLFWANAVYVWLHRERFGHSRPVIAAEIVLVTAAALFIRWYIKYNVDFYRLFMYAIYPELLMLLQLVWVLKKRDPCAEKEEAATTKRTSLEKVLLLLVLVLGVSLAAALYRLYAVNPLGSMFGMYQTEWTDGAFYNAQFFNKDQYYLEVDDGQRTKFSQGTYESLGNNHYLLTDQATGESTLITQGHRGFYYYYAPIDTVLYFTKRAP